MGRRLSDINERKIKAALKVKPHASLVARESNGAWSYSTVWRVALRAGIELTAGRETMGRKRISAEQRIAVIEARQANPDAAQREIGEMVGLSRSSVSRIESNGRRARGGQLALSHLRK